MADEFYKPRGNAKVQQDFTDWQLSNSKVAIEDYLKIVGGTESLYKPSPEELLALGRIKSDFVHGDIIMQKPRVEFNDLSVMLRAQYDEMSWNTYQPNNGEPAEQDLVGGWKSNAIRPVVRNKCISIAAHATARLIFPKVFAYDDESEIQENSAKVMEHLMEWSGDQSNYPYYALNRVIAAEIYPASIGYTEYSEVYRPQKTERGADGKWIEKMVCDEDLSGFQDYPVPVDQLYIENFYEPDIQKQGFLIWRRVRSFALLESIYKAKYPNFKYVTPGVQLIYNDANQSFYQVYDTSMRGEMCEEVIYWNRALDLKLIAVNGVLLTDADNPNPRNDKLFPFDKFGYEIINNRCFYYKSLVFKLQSDANIVNSLYPMIIDGTYLGIMPPMIATGPDMIGGEVMVPAMVTTMRSSESDLRPITRAADLKAGMETLNTVEKSLDESSQEPQQQGEQQSGQTTAYEISRLEQNANTVLGLFIKMISEHVRQFGKLRKGDIIQYLTIADADKILDNTELLYKTFLIPDKKGGGTHKKIQFDSKFATKPESYPNEHSYQVLAEQDKAGGKVELYKVNPERFRDLKFQISVSPDILNPRSEDLERAFKLELYDRAINNPLADQENVYKDFLLGAYRDVRDPSKYIAKQQAQGPQMPNLPGLPQGQPQNNANSPVKAMQGKTPLPQTM